MLLRSIKTLTSLCAIATLFSCSEFAKINGSEDEMVRFEYAKKMFENGEYTKAARLIEPVQIKLKTTEFAQASDWMLAYSMYKIKNYEMASFLLDNYAKSYPLSENMRTSVFLAATSAYSLSPESYLDQEYTQKAVTMLQRYIERFPDAENIEQVDKMVRELNTKLEKKYYDIAANYYRLEEFQAAIVAYSNMLDDYPATKYREEAMYHRFKASTIFAKNSVAEKQSERYKNALTYGKLLLKTFPNTLHKTESSTLLKEVESEIERLSKIKEAIEESSSAKEAAKKIRAVEKQNRKNNSTQSKEADKELNKL